MDFVAVVFILALLCFFSFDATVFSVNKDLYYAKKSQTNLIRNQVHDLLA